MKLKLTILALSLLFSNNIFAGGGIDKTLSGAPLSLIEIIFGGAIMLYIFIQRL